MYTTQSRQIIVFPITSFYFYFKFIFWKYRIKRKCTATKHFRYRNRKIIQILP